MRPIIEDIEENIQTEDSTPLLEQEPTQNPDDENKASDASPDTKTNPESANNTDDIFGNEPSNQIDLSLTDIGKTYVLRKIYSTLVQLIDYVMNLQTSVDDKALTQILSDLQTAKDLFVLLANNIEKYLSRLDSIIDYYRQFIIEVTKNIETIVNRSKKH